MQELERKFEALLAHWVPEPELQEDWRAHLYRGAAPPPAAPQPPPLTFKGRADTGSSIEVRQAGGAVQVWLDGQLVERRAIGPGLDRGGAMRFLDQDYREIFDAPDDAAAALAAWVASPDSEPPWPWARPLWEDGLIDQHFALTARGKRLLAQRSQGQTSRSARSSASTS